MDFRPGVERRRGGRPVGPKDERLATEDDEEEYWERDDEEIQKDLDELMSDSDEE